MPSTVATEEQVPFNTREFDQLDDSQSGAAFTADTCIPTCRLHDNEQRILLQRSFMPPMKESFDVIQYNYSPMMDHESFIVPVAKQPSSYRSKVAKQQNHIPEKHAMQSSQFAVAMETSNSSQTDSQRTSLSDLRTQYWELLHITGQISSKSKKPEPLISQIAKEKTVIDEKSELKSRIASLLGKILMS